MMTDLHTHILPGMDDGASDLEMALELLKMEQDQGVRNIALTSHFRCEKTSVEEFLARRERAYTRLLEGANSCGTNMCFRLGSEVFFSPRLLQMDVQPLCMEGTDLLLLELPVHHQPAFFEEGLLQFRAEGIVPLIAHAERYDYVCRAPAVLAKWIRQGALVQINAESVLGDQEKLALNLIRWGLAHIVSSDTHSPSKRPPNTAQAFEIIGRKLGAETAEKLEEQAQALFEGRIPKIGRVHEPKRVGPFWI